MQHAVELNARLEDMIQKNEDAKAQASLTLVQLRGHANGRYRILNEALRRFALTCNDDAGSNTTVLEGKSADPDAASQQQTQIQQKR